MLHIWFLLFFCVTSNSTSVDRLTVSQSIQEGQTLVSADGVIELGFFSPGNSTGRYLGIWYTKVLPTTVVWVANRNTPLQNKSGILKLNESGILVLLSGTNSIIWSSSNLSRKKVNNPSAYLMGSGNFVVENGQGDDENTFLWQSFDYPSDTFLPGMRLGWNLETGLKRSISSWTSVDDPAVGEYAVKLDFRGFPQVIELNGSHIKWRLTSSRSNLFRIGNLNASDVLMPDFVFNEKEVYYQYTLTDKSVFLVYKLTPSGTPTGFQWTAQNKTQQVILTGQRDQCDIYSICGSNSICSNDGGIQTCECLKSYVPKSPDQWNKENWSDGCVSRNKPDCKNRYTDDFSKYTYMKLPDTSSSWFNASMNLDACMKSCVRNCSCTAYVNLDVTDGQGYCVLWFNNLIDLRNYSDWGEDLYVRVPASKLDHPSYVVTKIKTVEITVGVIILGLAICACMFMIKNPGIARKLHTRHFKIKPKKEDIDVPTFDLSVLANATENFSTKNKLGEGGFGLVYKGTLVDGKVIAVKRLSKRSGQGLHEFRNEVMLIAKLQHRNLVKLLGCCIDGEEKMLIYEYMPNQSLDYFIFDETKKKLLNWCKRFNIINGIARGLLYLHQDSRLRIIHRDLKTSNILLDANLDSKISDFGLARSFLGDQVEANTNRLAGTYGYMSPEYAACGHFSVKSDVFSYGVIVLEIVCGKKNREFADSKNHNNLLGHAWRLWTKERALELLDDVLVEQCMTCEVLRCVHVALLCVQQRPEDRPNMSSVVSMLNFDQVLPKPKVPGFYTETDVTSNASTSSANHKLYSDNELSITVLDAR